VIVVLDTNTWVSALQFGLRKDGSPSTPLRALLQAASSDRIAICDEIRGEIIRILTTKFAWEVIPANATLDEWLETSLSVTITGELQVCRDPNDNMFLECALSANAALIVTGDQDLLALDPFREIRIVTAREYVHGCMISL
jgi:uncharacterized protein